MTGAGYEPADLGITGISDAVEIGSGGFGIVYRAVEADLGRTVAIKVLSGNLDEAAQLRFDRERRAMGTLSGHPNIVTIYRGGYTAAGNAYLIMELVSRGSLADRLKNEGPIPWPEVLKFGIQLSGALETSHRAGVLHRDIKPGNILYSGLGNTKLCDFGIARLHGAPETQSSVVTASIAHAPPEIINGRRPDAVADVYSLASTMFELLSGMPPFVHPTDESMVPILARIHTEPVPNLPLDQLPEPMVDVLGSAMAKDPAERPQTAYAFGEQMVQAQQALGQPPTAIPFAPGHGSEDGSSSARISPYPNTPSAPLPAPTGPSTASPAPAPTGAPPVTPTPAPTGAPPATPTPAPTGIPSRPSAPIPAPAPTGAPPVTPTPAPTGIPSRPSAPIPAPAPAPAPGAGDDRRWAFIAASGLAVLLVVALVAWLATRSGTDDEAAPGTTATGPASDGGASGDDQATTTSIGQSEDDYPFYRRISDQSGSISIDVPTEWTDVERRTGSNDLPFLAAAETLEGGFFGTFDEPGVAVSIIDPAGGDFDDLLDKATNASCISLGRSNMEIPYRGRVEWFAECDGTETQIFHAVVSDGFQNLTALLTIQILSDRDVVAAGTISDSLILEAQS